jgi:hypothetical protein
VCVCVCVCLRATIADIVCTTSHHTRVDRTRQLIDARTKAAAAAFDGANAHDDAPTTSGDDVFTPAPAPTRGGANATKWAKGDQGQGGDGGAAVRVDAGYRQTWNGAARSELADGGGGSGGGGGGGGGGAGEGSGGTWMDDFSSLPRPPSNVLASPPPTANDDVPFLFRKISGPASPQAAGSSANVTKGGAGAGSGADLKRDADRTFLLANTGGGDGGDNDDDSGGGASPPTRADVLATFESGVIAERYTDVAQIGKGAGAVSRTP